MQNENIQLSLPINAAYVSAARLTASSIANRLNFSIDEIEDIKAAVSEACTFIIKRASTAEEFKILFKVDDDIIKIIISVALKINLQSDEEEMGLMMIKALMDEFEITSENGSNSELCMVKYHKQSLFD